MKSWKMTAYSELWVNWCMAWLLLSCSITLLFPDALLHGAVSEWIERHITYLVLGILFSSAYFLARALLLLWDWLMSKLEIWHSQHRLERMINHLDFAEKAILREFVLQRKSVIKLPLAEPAVKNMLDSGILDFAYGQPSSNDQAHIKPMMISLRARPLLTYKVLGMSRGNMSEEQIEQMMSARPKFAKN
ncbi:superinfection exclusion B family protein [Dongshaea marina]|uniref:superinfection exclusion B family protein n=1 Tax=Dongshaea marina TaxID=2047966 RepID=UPI000D3E17A8|nr:superinfection exclusion B family protein [Dongshaea marina]